MKMKTIKYTYVYEVSYSSPTFDGLFVGEQLIIAKGVQDAINIMKERNEDTKVSGVKEIGQAILSISEE